MSEVKNTSGIRPLGRAVLVKPYDLKKTTLVIPDSARENAAALEMRAVVVEVGPVAWPDEPPRAKAGDRVLIARYSGAAVRQDVTMDGESYRIINDRDIFAGIEKEQEE